MDRRRLLMNGGGSFETSRIEYLESDGNQYIDTGIELADEYSFEYTFAVTDLTKKTGVMGTRNSTYVDANLSVYIDQYGKLRLDLVETSYPITISQGERFSLQFIYDNSAGHYARVLGISYYRSAVINTANSLCLFTFSEASGNVTSYGGAPQKVYRFRVYRYSDLIMDLIPYKYKGEGCMYDLVSGEYFFNLGTGNFTCGPEVSDVSVGLRTFDIYNVKTANTFTYTVPEDMTWREFVNSTYNDLGLIVHEDSSNKWISDGNYNTLGVGSDNYVSAWEPIGDKMRYILWY